MRKIIFFLLAITLLFSACKTQNLMSNTIPSLAKVSTFEEDMKFWYNPNFEYTIKKDDKINISVWGQDELSVGSVYGIYNSNEVYGKWLLVDVDGNIEVPRIGTINVKGMTVPKLKTHLKTLLTKWLVNPIVDVKVLNKEISLLGELRNPSTFTVDKDVNHLFDLVAKAGGFEFYANLKCVKVLRQDGENVRVLTLDLTETGKIIDKNITMFPGDVVIVPSKKYKEFDKRISTIIPFATVATATAILKGAF